MPNVMGREFPYTPQGMAAARQYSQAMGMRDGGSMGFRPVGYANGGAAGSETRAATIEKLMDMTGMGANTFVGLSNEQLTAAVQKVEADALAAQMQQEQRSAPSAFGDARLSNQDIDREYKNSLGRIDQYLQQMQQFEEGANAGGVEGFVGAPQQIPNFPGVVPDEQGGGYGYYPPGMYNGGLMSLGRR